MEAILWAIVDLLYALIERALADVLRPGKEELERESTWGSGGQVP